MILAIDPGYASTGWALFSEELIHTGVFQVKHKSALPWYKVVDVWQDRLSRILRDYVLQIETVVCEEMQIMGGAGGYATARTSLMGMAGSVGMWAAWTYVIEAEFSLAPIPQWKGQMPKALVNKRIQKILTPGELKLLTPNKSHDWDAAGIGLWYQGRF